MRPRIAIVVQRYGLEINGGAEYHARLIAERLARRFAVEIWTTTALDYITWEPHFAPGREIINGIPVHRFHVKKRRDPTAFGLIQKKVFEEEHSLADELQWLEEEGPNVPQLLDALAGRGADFDHLLFFSYRYYHAYHGVYRFPGRAILVPTAEHDEVIHLRLFRELFRLPAAIVYNSIEERELIQAAAGTRSVPGDVVGVGSEIPESFDPAGAWRRLDVAPPYFIYIGRLDENKGVPELFDYFLRFAAETGRKIPLYLVGKSVIPIPSHPLIRPLGFLSDRDKFDILAGSQFLVIPSLYESLSMVCLEAWALGKPVLVNGRTEVLAGQCRRSRAGLWYESYDQFREALLLLLDEPRLCEELGRSGRAYFSAHYAWDVIEDKYLRLLQNLRPAAACKNI
jgi:glycosyltransferase involved in cell wall biosynthesis